MRLLDDFLPALVFLLVYKLSNIYWGTFALIIASALQIVYLQMRYKKVQPVYWFSFWVILIFGTATILFRDPRFLQWKVSIFSWMMGAAFLISYLFKRTLIEMIFASSQAVPIPLLILRRLNFIWALFCLFIGILNIYIAYHFSLNTWVNFKVFGILGLAIVFSIIQTLYLMYLIKKMTK